MGCLLAIFLFVTAIFAGFAGVAQVDTQAEVQALPTLVVLPIEINYDDIPQNRTDDGAFILGNPDAPITVVAFEDFLCPHCQAYQPTIREFIADYVVTGQARFEFRMLPISQFSTFVFGLVECAEILEPNSFWESHDAMFNLTANNELSMIASDFADEIDLSEDELVECAENAQQYTSDQALAGEYSTFITGTPTVAWRLNNSDLRFDIISRQPTASDLGSLVEMYSN